MEGGSGIAKAVSWVPPGHRGTEAGPARRLIEVTALVALWIGIGEIYTGAGSGTASVRDLNWYLLTGIPLIAVFQLWVRREPIKALWVRSAPGMARAMLFRILFVALAIFSAYTVFKVIDDSPPAEASLIVYALVAIGGAAAGAYAYTHFGRETFKYLGLCILTAGVLGAGPQVLHGVFTHSASHPVGGASPESDLWVFLVSLLTYLPSLYVLEEVAFRGCFDAHVHNENDRGGLGNVGGMRGVLTAIYISLLWGAWHAPLFGWDNILILLAYQGIIGTFLSIFWRKSGNLGVTATTHALIDSVRNAAGNIP